MDEASRRGEGDLWRSVGDGHMAFPSTWTQLNRGVVGGETGSDPRQTQRARSKIIQRRKTHSKTHSQSTPSVNRYWSEEQECNTLSVRGACMVVRRDWKGVELWLDAWKCRCIVPDKTIREDRIEQRKERRKSTQWYYEDKNGCIQNVSHSQVIEGGWGKGRQRGGWAAEVKLKSGLDSYPRRIRNVVGVFPSKKTLRNFSMPLLRSVLCFIRGFNKGFYELYEDYTQTLKIWKYDIPGIWRFKNLKILKKDLALATGVTGPVGFPPKKNSAELQQKDKIRGSLTTQCI